MRAKTARSFITLLPTAQDILSRPLILRPSGKFHGVETEFEDKSEYYLMNGRYLLYAFKSDHVKPWALLNFRLTKELGKIAEVSFMANNFLGLKKYHVNKNSLTKRQLYPDQYFGAELKLKF